MCDFEITTCPLLPLFQIQVFRVGREGKIFSYCSFALKVKLNKQKFQILIDSKSFLLNVNLVISNHDWFCLVINFIAFTNLLHQLTLVITGPNHGPNHVALSLFQYHFISIHCTPWVVQFQLIFNIKKTFFWSELLVIVVPGIFLHMFRY